MKVVHLLRKEYEVAEPYAGIVSIKNKLLENSFIVVIDGDNFFGILTSKDIVKSPYTLAIDCLNAKPNVDYEQDIKSVLELMRESRNSILPVFKFGKFIGIVTGTDIIDFLFEYQRRAEKDLRESEEKYRDLYDNAPDMFASVDAKTTTILECNQTLVDALGYAKEDIIGRSIFDMYTPDSVEDAKASVSSVFLKTGTIKGVELQLQRKDGSALDVSLNVSSVRDEKGYIIRSRLVWRDITERKHFEEQIKASLKEKEVLLGEIHHRVKNNMQVIISMLRLQSANIKDKKYADMFKESQNRIKSMSLIHDKLYQSKGFANIDLGEYVNSLINGLFITYRVDPNKIRLNMEIKDVLLGFENFIPCGLIINELVSNSLKYAFPEGREGEISIALGKINENEIKLTVSDDGIGLPEDLDIRNTESMGLQLVMLLAEYQLKGKIEWNRTGGTGYHIKFKSAAVNPRI